MSHRKAVCSRSRSTHHSLHFELRLLSFAYAITCTTDWGQSVVKFIGDVGYIAILSTHSQFIQPLSDPSRPTSLALRLTFACIRSKLNSLRNHHRSRTFLHSFDLRTTQVERRRPTLAPFDSLHSLVDLYSPYIRSLQVDPSRIRFVVAIARTSSPMSFVLRLLVRIYPIFDSIYL
ncbi:hypothetical protein M405DRAFT_869815 [Rhizopogon salebrosus TDB-379]|nr:hypothetical protein M405DRAFT_869815 [Rhizopogon salebrosus TDB-379]